MARRVQGPDGVVREFPDDATDEEIAEALDGSGRADYLPPVARGAQALMGPMVRSLPLVGGIAGGVLGAGGGPLGVAAGAALGSAGGQGWRDVLLGETAPTSGEAAARLGSTAVQAAAVPAALGAGGRVLRAVVGNPALQRAGMAGAAELMAGHGTIPATVRATQALFKSPKALAAEAAHAEKIAAARASNVLPMQPRVSPVSSSAWPLGGQPVQAPQVRVPQQMPAQQVAAGMGSRTPVAAQAHPAAPSAAIPPPASPQGVQAAMMRFGREAAAQNPKIGEKIWVLLDDAGMPIKTLTPGEAAAAARLGKPTTWIKNLWRAAK